MPKTVDTRSHCKVWLRACNNLPQPSPYISFFWGLRKIVACSQPYLAVASCIYSFWHGVIPTSYYIFTLIYDYFTEPKISLFPDDKQVLEGEEVVFRVKVTGVPVPELKWYHNGEEVIADYSKDLADDGSLTMPSAETKHSGVYQLVAVNRAGRVVKNVRLCVNQEGQPCLHGPKKGFSMPFLSIHLVTMPLCCQMSC